MTAVTSNTDPPSVWNSGRRGIESSKASFRSLRLRKLKSSLILVAVHAFSVLQKHVCVISGD